MYNKKRSVMSNDCLMRIIKGQISIIWQVSNSIVCPDMVQSNEGKLQQVQAGKVNMASCLSGWVSSALASATYTFCLWVILIFRRFYSTLPARFGFVTRPARSNATIIVATAMPRNTLNPVSMRLCEGPCGEYRMNNSSKYIYVWIIICT